METFDCHSSIKAIDDSFEKLAVYIIEAQSYINSWQLKNQTENDQWFEIPTEFLEPLEKLSHLIISIHNQSQVQLDNDQFKVLFIWMRAIALSYCFAKSFIQISERTVDKNELAHQFYVYTSSELRTPFVMSKAYSKILQNESKSQSKSNFADQFVKQVLAPPFIPNHHDTLVQIDHWIEQFLKLINTLITHIAKGGTYER